MKQGVKLMTQYSDDVQTQKALLAEQEKKKEITSIETRFDNGTWVEQTIVYSSGKRVTEFNDKRKKNLEEYYGMD